MSVVQIKCTLFISFLGRKFLGNFRQRGWRAQRAPFLELSSLSFPGNYRHVSGALVGDVYPSGITPRGGEGPPAPGGMVAAAAALALLAGNAVS